MNSLRIGIGQINACVGDFKGNSRKVCEFIAKAKKSQCDLVVFPELILSGYPPEDLLLKQHFRNESIYYTHEVAKKVTGNISAIYGFIDVHKKNIYNAAAIAFKEKVQGVYHKMQLPNYGVFDEKRYFSRGEHYTILNIGDIKAGVTICEDIWIDNGPAQIDAFFGNAELIINLSASPYHLGKLHHRFDIVSKTAKKTNSYICYVNLVGGQDELVFDGGSFICDYNGKIYALAREFQEDFIVIDLKDFDLLRKKRQNRKYFKKTSALPLTEANKIVSVNIPVNRKIYKTIKPKKVRKISVCEEVYSALVLGLKDYAAKNGFKKAVLGISGGIDSALTAVIAKDALGKENVTAISMPSRFSSESSRSDAKKMAKNLGIKFMEIPIDSIFNQYIQILKPSFADTKPGTAEENIQARVRGNILMALSNRFGWIVLSTGNKSEMAVGYATLYGDMAGGFAVLKDVPKTLVYKLSKYCNKKHNKVIIPQSIIKKEPSAELRFNQKDRDELPEYSLLDKILDQYVEQDKSLKEIISMGYPKAEVKKVVSMIDKNEYKRRQAPIGIRITPKAFGRDRRMPVTNKYRG